MRYRFDTGVIIDQETGEILPDIKIRNRLNQQDQEIKHIHTIIDDMIQTERTEIGKSVLKQLKEMI